MKLILHVKLFNLGDNFRDVFSSRDNGALPHPVVRCLWDLSRKHGGLFVLNLSPLSKSMLEINFHFYDQPSWSKTQLKILFIKAEKSIFRLTGLCLKYVSVTELRLHENPRECHWGDKFSSTSATK